MYKVLLVDDETIIKIALRSAVKWEEHGFVVCGTASNGREALGLIEKLKPQLVITDIKMPSMNGIELIQQMRRKYDDIEVIVLSNYDDFESVRSALLLGASDYMLKVKLEESTLVKILQVVKEKLGLKEQEKCNENEQNLEGEENYLNTEEGLSEIFFQSDQTMASFREVLKKVSKIDIYHNISIGVLNFVDAQTPLSASVCDASSALLIRNILLDMIQNARGYQLLTMSKTKFLILHEEEEMEQGEKPIRERSFVQVLAKIAKRFELYPHIVPNIFYYYKARDYECARSIFREEEKVNPFYFYNRKILINMREFNPMHYMNFVEYKEAARELFKNRDKSPGVNQEIIYKVIEKSEERSVYPEILKLFFIKVLDYILYSLHEVSVETHDYINEIKDDIRVCQSKTGMINFLNQSLTAMFHPQVFKDKEAMSNYKPEVDRAIHFIQQNYTKKISLDVISKEVNLSPGYLCRSFKTQVGSTITNYINGLRLEQAKVLLMKPDCTVKEVSYQVGFDDPLYFSRLFKKHYNMSPSTVKK